MLPGRCRQSATLSCQSPVHARNVLLGPGHRLRRSGYLLPQGLALRLRLLGSLEQIGTVGVRVGHNRTSIPLSPLLPAPHQIAPELVSITLLPLQGAAAPTTPATASPRLRPRRPHRRGLQRSPAPDHRRPDERIGAEAPDRQQAQGRRWPPPVPATAHPGRPGGSGTGDRPRAPPARPSPEPFLGRVQGARRVGPAHPASLGSSWSRPSERWLSACWSAARLMKPSTCRAWAANSPLGSVLRCNRLVTQPPGNWSYQVAVNSPVDE